MGADSNIQWTRHTFNPWRGCAKASPGCANCYAEAFDRRTHGTDRHTDARGVVREPHWGKDAPRRFFVDKHWRQPLAWNRAAELAGERRRVFCASMADVFEDRPDLVEPRARLFALIRETPWLDWQLLTKRPENIARLWPASAPPPGADWPNVWLGTSIACQEDAARNVPLLLKVPAAVRFLSVEPLIGLVDLRRWLWTCGGRGECADPDIPWHDSACPAVAEPRIGWVIVGGESGPGARPCDVAWIRDVVRQCREAGLPCFVKQLGAEPLNLPMHAGGGPVYLRDRKGGDPAEWPADLRVREFPGGGA